MGDETPAGYLTCGDGDEEEESAVLSVSVWCVGGPGMLPLSDEGKNPTAGN